MARWRITAKHYIHAEQFGQVTKWVQEETNVSAAPIKGVVYPGRTIRKEHIVPMLIDPDDPWCINPNEGFCVVATRGSEKPGDIVLVSDVPTPDMEPLDDAAREISDKYRSKWVSPIDGMPISMGEDFGSKLLQLLEQQLNTVPMQGQPQPANVSLASASNDEVAALRAQMAEMQKMMAQMMGGSAVGEAEPLTDLDPEAPPQPPKAAPAGVVAPRKPAPQGIRRL